MYGTGVVVMLNNNDVILLSDVSRVHNNPKHMMSIRDVRHVAGPTIACAVLFLVHRGPSHILGAVVT